MCMCVEALGFEWCKEGYFGGEVEWLQFLRCDLIDKDIHVFYHSVTQAYSEKISEHFQQESNL